MALRRPFHWNPVTVQIAALDDVQVFDPVFKTPINQKKRTTVRLYQAQVNFGRNQQDRRVRFEAGDRPDTTAHLVMRTCDLAPNVAALPKPKKGWKITGLYMGTHQEQVVDYLIEQIRHESPLRGAPLLIYVEFRENVERGPP